MNSGKGLSFVPSPAATGEYPHQLAEFDFRFHQVIVSVTGWIKNRKSVASAGYLVFKPDDLVLYVVSTSRSYDFVLAKELADFSVQLADQGTNVNIRLLPESTPDELSAYFDRQRTFKLWD